MPLQICQSCRMLGMLPTIGIAAPRQEVYDFAIVGVEQALHALK